MIDRILHVSYMYRTCILHVSYMYPTCPYMYPTCIMIYAAPLNFGLHFTCLFSYLSEPLSVYHP